MTTLSDAPHQHESRSGHKVLATSTICDQSKSECSIIDQRPNIREQNMVSRSKYNQYRKITPETHHLSSIPKGTFLLLDNPKEGV